MFISTHSKKAFEPMRFSREKELQDSIEALPELLNPIAQLNEQGYPFFILKRELNVSSGAIDFLAVDYEGSLYIVETKLAENPEIRRAIIGQVIEYASNLSDMPYDKFSSECLKYLKRQVNLEQAVHDFYFQQRRDDEVTPSAEEYRIAISNNLAKGRLNLVIVANQVNFEIQKLIYFIDEKTRDDLNFIVLEINKYHIDSEVFLHSHILWAAKYIKSLFSRRQIDEGTYLASLSPHVQMLVKHIDSYLSPKGLSKTANTKGLSWKHPSGGSILVMGNVLDTNWSTLPGKKSKNEELKKAVEAGFAVTPSKHGRMKVDLTNSVSVNIVETYIELALSVILKADELKP